MDATSGNQTEGAGRFLYTQLHSDLKGRSSFADGMNSWSNIGSGYFFGTVPGSGGGGRRVTPSLLKTLTRQNSNS